ncbi:hypothetical protein F66182_1955 [Fusarium sp. NRRL 66182]|nr:hypothetical protein F66182_1955 [Fusarium sp. NRRL 66182]
MGSSTSKTQQARSPPASAMSADNSHGASVAALELSSALSETLSEIDLSGGLNEQLRQLLHRLDQEASKYTNSKVSDDASTEWNPPQAEVQLISAAWKCARGTYDLESSIADTSYCTFHNQQVLEHSLTGTVKAITSTSVEPAIDSEATHELLPVLMIAIRGSASKMDHIVNANSRSKATEGFIHPAFLSQPNLQAHSGFLNSAWALDSIVTDQVNKHVESFNRDNGQQPHILFTGHSAGGAVAQLLYLGHIANKDLGEWSKYNPSVERLDLYHKGDSSRFSCVTFGAPPCVTAHVDLSLYQPSGNTLCVNIINEFDVVTRADKPYILSMVDLARAMLDLPPNASVLAHETDDEIVGAALEATHDKESKLISRLSRPHEKNVHVEDANVWRLPRPFYHHVGHEVVLLLRLLEGRMALRAVEMMPTDFQKLLFCRVAVHGKRCYGERIEALEQGHFNGRLGWESDKHHKAKSP